MKLFYPEGIDHPYHTVSIAGSFNGWNPEVDQLTHNTNSQKWEIELPLSINEKIYFKFIIDGKDWRCSDSYKIESDDSGNANNVAVVSSSPPFQAKTPFEASKVDSKDQQSPSPKLTEGNSVTLSPIKTKDKNILVDGTIPSILDSSTLSSAPSISNKQKSIFTQETANIDQDYSEIQSNNKNVSSDSLAEGTINPSSVPSSSFTVKIFDSFLWFFKFVFCYCFPSRNSNSTTSNITEETPIVDHGEEVQETTNTDSYYGTLSEESGTSNVTNT